MMDVKTLRMREDGVYCEGALGMILEELHVQHIALVIRLWRASLALVFE